MARTCFDEVSTRRAGKKTPSPRGVGSVIGARPPRASGQILLEARLLTSLGEILVEKIDQCALLRRVAKAVDVVREMLGQSDGRAAAEILHDNDRVNVRLSCYRRGVAKLSGDETDRGDDVLLPLVLALSLPQLGEHGRGTKRSAPGTEILCRVGKLRDCFDVVVDVARIHILPLLVLEITEEARSRR